MQEPKPNQIVKIYDLTEVFIMAPKLFEERYYWGLEWVGDREFNINFTSPAHEGEIYTFKYVPK